MAQDSDPVGNGFVASLARPGGNITGLSNLSPELSAKQLELLKEIVPRLSRVAVLGHSTDPGNAQALSETERAAGRLGVQLQYLDVRSPKDIETAFDAAKKARAGAVLVLNSPVAASHRARLAELAVRSRLPVMHQVGGGAKPTGLPVEQPTRFELTINLKAARQIGLTIPLNVLARADRVIK